MKHMIIPDAQVKEGVPLEHLTWAGKYASDKKPDVIICIGDWADMPSLSSYDKGKKDFEGRRYTKDIAVAKKAMELFLAPIKTEMKKGKWKPRMVLTLGNHENRINRAVNDDPKLEGLISVKDLPYGDWEVYPYLQPVNIHGIIYSHFFTSGVLGRPVSSARALTTKKHCSCVMGHVQKKEIDIQYNAMGKRITSICCGTFYQHDEDYLTPQENASTWRGVWMLHGIKDGEFDELPVSLDYLKSKYEKQRR